MLFKTNVQYELELNNNNINLLIFFFNSERIEAL